MKTLILLILLIIFFIIGSCTGCSESDVYYQESVPPQEEVPEDEPEINDSDPNLPVEEDTTSVADLCKPDRIEWPGYGKDEEIHELDRNAWSIKRGDLVLCWIPIIFRWNPSNDEDVKELGVEGVVQKVGQCGTSIYVDFKHGYKKRWIIKHKLNFRKRWKAIRDCGIVPYEHWKE